MGIGEIKSMNIFQDHILCLKTLPLSMFHHPEILAFKILLP